MNYISKTVHIAIDTTVASPSFVVGDYAMIYNDAQTGTVDYTTSVSTDKVALYPGDTVNCGHEATASGNWIYAMVSYDSKGNKTSGTGDEDTVFVDCVPMKLDKMTATSYDSGTGVLTLGL